ncbi:para-nitrobenzyl esterase [Kitasatospora sp. MAP12-15]|uniref:carboxylesterase/lipase family protein n=1 Tax=unclassified Kitasatospora TaxID=2633591 RepID=UPI002473C920|nr:carboxylesterase family protein [Kitasatospora sp. MAP12-44]MDH6109468.1 para-nitrobenzyl esterase [Kitasatospora sp. MAP12-44]
MTQLVPPDPEVRTAAGTVRGRAGEGVAVFRGIPYALPPVGGLRFAAPVPVPAWSGVREAAAFGPPPPQPSFGTAPPTRAPTSPGSPDEHGWLTVNVWTPGPGAGDRPVLVWIHGGAYQSGDCSVPTYDGARLAREGDAVVVSCNYRVGAEGFAQLDGVPANRGLLDQVAALRWVRENIAAFGGDPLRVTVFGQSAGAGSIAALLAMPAAAGLLHRAILQSVPGTFFSAALAREIAVELAADLGAAPTADALRDTDPQLLVAAGCRLASGFSRHAHRWGRAIGTLAPYAPVVDGTVLPTDPWSALAAGAARSIALVIGHTKDEFAFRTAAGHRLGQVSEEAAALSLSLFAPGPDGAAAYRAAHPLADAGALFDDVNSDWYFRMPSLKLAEAQARAGGAAYLYQLATALPADGDFGAVGAPHGADTPLVFGNYRLCEANPFYPDPPGARTEALGTAIRRAWTAFARTGDPGWPAFDAERRLTRVFGAAPAVVRYPEEAARRIWADHPMAALDVTATAAPGSELERAEQLGRGCPAMADRMTTARGVEHPSR